MIRKLLAITVIAFVVTACDQPQQGQTTAPSPVPPQTRYWLVFFDLNSTALSQRSLDTVREAANTAKSIPNAHMTLTGNTDTDGPADFNQALSLKRANTVKDALVKEGVSPASITVTGRGKDSPLIVTPDQVKLESNRRVEIVIR